MQSLIPQNPEAESAAIGCLLLGASPDAVPLRPDHFACPANALVFSAIRTLADKSDPVDVHTVTSLLTANGTLEHAGGPAARFLSATSPIGGNALLTHHFETLEQVRQIRTATLFIRKHLPDLESANITPETFADQLQSLCSPLNSSRGLSPADIIASIEARGTTPPETFTTGLPDLDSQLRGGIHRKELATIAGETGRGKSALLLQIAAQSLASNRPVLYVSLEMPAEDVFYRITSAGTGIHPSHPGFRRALLDHHQSPLTVHDDASDLADILALIRSAARHTQTPLAIVDYLQLVETKADSRELAMSEIARRLKATAQAENIAILTASQLNDNGQLRESRAIGHHSNLVLHITDDGIRCPKFRRGPSGWISPATLDGPTSRFVTT